MKKYLAFFTTVIKSELSKLNDYIGTVIGFIIHISVFLVLEYQP